MKLTTKTLVFTNTNPNPIVVVFFVVSYSLTTETNVQKMAQEMEEYKKRIVILEAKAMEL